MDTDTLQEEVIDGEVVEEESPSNVTKADQATILLSLEDLIKGHIDSLDKLSDALKKHRQMFADAFENNPTYRELEEGVKEANKKKSSVREQIVKQPAMQDIGQKIKDMNTELKEKKNALSDYLLEYQRLAKVNEIEGYDGEVRDIINNARLIKRSSREIAQSKQK